MTAGSADKIARCVELGAAGGHSRHEGSFVDAVNKFSDGAGADVILDPVGASYLADNQAALAIDGRLVIIGLMGGMQADVNLGLMMMKRQRVIGSTLRARSIPAKSAVMDALYERVWPLIATGEIKPIIEAEVSMADAASAHELIAGNQTIGKVILTL